MPFMCCVPGCNGNYSAAEKVHVFSFPSEEVLRKNGHQQYTGITSY
nr:unnamed protein product [Callosobruchus analis]